MAIMARFDAHELKLALHLQKSLLSAVLLRLQLLGQAAHSFDHIARILAAHHGRGRFGPMDEQRWLLQGVQSVEGHQLILGSV